MGYLNISLFLHLVETAAWWRWWIVICSGHLWLNSDSMIDNYHQVDSRGFSRQARCSHHSHCPRLSSVDGVFVGWRYKDQWGSLFTWVHHQPRPLSRHVWMRSPTGTVIESSGRHAMSLWRNRLARSAVNRKVGGSSPPRDVGVFFPISKLFTNSLKDCSRC